MTVVFAFSWLTIGISVFEGALVVGAIASTSESAIFSHAKASHQSNDCCHGFRSFSAELVCKPFVPDAVSESREGFRVWTVDDLVLFD